MMARPARLYEDPHGDTVPLRGFDNEEEPEPEPSSFLSTPGSTPTTPHHPKTPRSLVPARYKRYNWTFELLCLATSAFAILTSAVMLRMFHGRPVPPWSLGSAGFSLNSILSLLSTLSRSSLLIPLDEALGQLMWLTFAESDGKGRRLVEAELYNQASRGPWGALKLLLHRRGRGIASLGCALMWLAVGLGTAQQQLLAYPTKTTNVFDPAQANVGCSPHTYNTYQLMSPTNSSTSTPMVSFAVSVSLFSSLVPNKNSPTPPFTCVHGNCEYPRFTTLAICSRCTPPTPLPANCPEDDGIDGDASVCHASAYNISATVWRPNSKHTANTSSTILNQTAVSSSAANILTLNTVIAYSNDHWPPYFTSQRCELLWCTRDVTARVDNSTYRETVSTRSEVPKMAANGTATFSTTGHNSTVFHVSPSAQKAFKALSLSLGGWSRRGPGGVWTHSSALFAGLADLAESSSAEDVATSMARGLSAAIRSDAVAIKGSRVERNAIVVARWGWLIYPTVIWCASAVFLGTTIWRAKKSEERVGFWGASVLAAMMWAPASHGEEGEEGGGGYGMDKGGGGEEIRRTVIQGGAGWSALGMEQQADRVRVRLVKQKDENDGGEGGWRLVKVGMGAGEV